MKCTVFQHVVAAVLRPKVLAVDGLAAELRPYVATDSAWGISQQGGTRRYVRQRTHLADLTSLLAASSVCRCPDATAKRNSPTSILCRVSS